MSVISTSVPHPPTTLTDCCEQQKGIYGGGGWLFYPTIWLTGIFSHIPRYCAHTMCICVWVCVCVWAAIHGHIAASFLRNLPISSSQCNFFFRFIAYTQRWRQLVSIHPFIVHNGKTHTHTHAAKQSALSAFSVESASASPSPSTAERCGDGMETLSPFSISKAYGTVRRTRLSNTMESCKKKKRKKEATNNNNICTNDTSICYHRIEYGEHTNKCDSDDGVRIL